MTLKCSYHNELIMRFQALRSWLLFTFNKRSNKNFSESLYTLRWRKPVLRLFLTPGDCERLFTLSIYLIDLLWEWLQGLCKVHSRIIPPHTHTPPSIPAHLLHQRENLLIAKDRLVLVTVPKDTGRINEHHLIIKMLQSALQNLLSFFPYRQCHFFTSVLLFLH